MTKTNGRRGFAASVLPSSRVVLLDGDLDPAAVEPFTAAAASLTVGRRGDVVVDLSMLCIVDAAGLGALVTLRNLLARNGNRLLLRHATARTTHVFDTAGLSDLLTDG